MPRHKKQSASLVAAQQSFFAENNIAVHKIHVEDKKKNKPKWIDSYDINKLGLCAGNMRDYIENLNNSIYFENQLKKAKL